MTLTVPTVSQGYHPVLILDSNYAPLTLWPLPLWYWQDVIRGLCLGSLSPIVAGPVVIKSPSIAMRLPLVAKTLSVNTARRYHRKRFVRLTPEHLFLRDMGCCVYCLREVHLRSRSPMTQATVDHIMPRSRGGKNSWKNVVLACASCNAKKDNRTPQEAGMPLSIRPWSPTPAEILKLRLTRGRLAQEVWHEFLTPPTDLPRVDEVIHTFAAQAAV